MKRLISSLPLFFTVTALLAQDDPTATATPVQLNEEQAAAVVAGCLGGGIVVGIIWLISLGLWLWAAIFVMKDAKRRNSPNATLVTVLTWIPFTWFIGWLIHMITRPKTVAGAPNP